MLLTFGTCSWGDVLRFQSMSNKKKVSVRTCFHHQQIKTIKNCRLNVDKNVFSREYKFLHEFHSIEINFVCVIYTFLSHN